jgi:benzoate membrane transport protein
MSQFDNNIQGKRNIRNILRDLNLKNTSAGLVSGLLAWLGPPALILEASAKGNFSTEQTILWIFSIFVFGGILGILMPLYFQKPIVGATSLTAVAFLTTVTTNFTFKELVGTYILAGILLLIIGYLRVFSKLISYVPKEIIAAMLAGMILKYMINFVVSISQLAVVGGGALITFFIFIKWVKRIPPMLGAISVGFVLLLFTFPIHNIEITAVSFSPQIQDPEFNILSFLSVSIPIVLLVLSNDAAVGLGALEQNGFHPPVDRVITLSGIFTILAGFFGGQSANVAGMMSAICSDEQAGPMEKRYAGAVVTGVMLLLFGVFAWQLVPFIQALPQSFIAILVGFALIGVFSNSLHVSFAKPSMKISVVFSFLIAASNITVFSISAPVWSLIFGTLIARYVEVTGQ